MGLRAKFNLAIFVAFAIGFLIAAVVLDRVFVEDARKQVVQNARIMMTAANAIRDYTANNLGPLLPQENHGKFVAENIPAFAAQENFKAVKAAFEGYVYREPALNPTNMIDRAQDWEADIIGLFRNDPTRQELIVERDTPLGPTLNLARPLTVNEEACLSCHGAPADAPAVLTRTYGSDNGFGWKLHETVGAQILSVPMAVAKKLARDAYVTFMGILIAIFLVIFLIINLLLHYLVLVPVKRVSVAADAVSMGNEDVEVYVAPGSDEIASLSVSFNRMRESLKQAMAMIK